MKRLLWVIVIALWVALLASAFFTRVEADDYCYAAVVQEVGILGSVHHWYHNWSGLYTDQLISSVFAAVEPYGTRLGVPIMLGMFVLAWWYALNYWYKRWDALLLALAFGAALALSRPNDEPIYWISGSTSYWLPFAGTGLLLGALMRRQTILAVLSVFVTVSLSEPGAVLILAGLGLAFLFWKGERRRLLIVGAAGVLGFLIVYFAPGNAVRLAALNPVRGDTLFSVQSVRVVLGGFATNALLSAIWAVVPGLFLSGVGALLGAPFATRRYPLIFLLFALAGAFGIALIAVFTIGWGVDQRVMFLLVPFWLAQFFFLGALIGQRVPAARWLILISLVLLISSVQHVFARADYARRWDDRHEQILAGAAVPQDIGTWDTFWLDVKEGFVGCAEAWYGFELRFDDSPMRILILPDES